MKPMNIEKKKKKKKKSAQETFADRAIPMPEDAVGV